MYANIIPKFLKHWINRILKDRLRKIKIVLLDVDGVLTDGRFFYSDDGREFKSFDVKDGFAIRMAGLLGLKFAIITGKMSPIVERRGRELGVEEIHQGYFNKIEVYEDIKLRNGYSDDECAFIGDDLFDLGVLSKAGFSACPADAVEEVKSSVDFISQNPGGRGAVRELIELIMNAQEVWEPAVERFKNGEIIDGQK
ncbi:MAG: HAD hydrolase family protein [FCB group bacterium]|nr:HAD hydrolase family protein [FCB group bacterium]